MEWAIWIAVGVAIFLVFGLKDCVQIVADASVRKAEAAAAKAEDEATLARTELERVKFEHEKTLT